MFDILITFSWSICLAAGFFFGLGVAKSNLKYRLNNMGSVWIGKKLYKLTEYEGTMYDDI